MHDSSPIHKPLSVMAFDYGTKRIGVAVGNSLTKSAQNLPVILNADEEQRFSAIGKIIAKWAPDAIVIGLPLHPDGAEHAMTQKARRFGQQIGGRHSKPVYFVDERYSSVVLEGDVQYQESLDSHAAALILEQFFRELKI
jgi:putative Holliday junction resolvase